METYGTAVWCGGMKDGDGYAITAAHLTLKATILGATHETFQELACKAKAGCPVPRLLDATITLDASLAG